MAGRRSHTGVSFVTRFAPSPTGPLHLGHAYSAMLAYDMAMASGGEFLLRIEDIDRTRARPEWEAQIYDDLAWLGLIWATPVMRQSDNLPRYRAALQNLWTRGLIYPCSCTRADIQAASSAPQEGAMPLGPDGPVYPGTCRLRPKDSSEPLPENVLRLDMAKALAILPAGLGFDEFGDGTKRHVDIDPQDVINTIGDVVLARRDMGTSYHLSVVVDDAAQNVTHVVRGKDLFEATTIHVILQHLLALPVPDYHHHLLIRDETGKRLAKRDDARAISAYRAEGAAPSDIRFMVGL